MTLKGKYFNIVFVSIFMGAILMPLAFMDVSGGTVSESENRMLAARPPMSYALQHPRDFVQQFDSWFADNVGFREFFIDCNKLTSKLDNNIRYTDGQYVMLIGEQGHHFFAHTDGWMIRKFQGKSFVSDEHLQGMTKGLSKAKQYLDEKGIPLVVMLCTDKETIYPEYYPKSIMRGPEPIQLDIITDYAKANTDVDLFNIKECLLSAKQSYPVFDKVGDARGILSHYNEIGSFFAYQELMKHIKVYMPEMSAFTMDDVNITYADRGIYPNIPKVQLNRDTSFYQRTPEFFEGVPLGHPSQGVAYKSNTTSSPTILFMRDSYVGTGYHLSRFVPEHFGESILIHWGNMENLERYVERFNPDIVVFESAERELDGFASSLMSYANLP